MINDPCSHTNAYILQQTWQKVWGITRQAEAETRAHLDELQVCEGSYCVVGTVAGRAGGVSQIKGLSGGLTLCGHRRLMDWSHKQSSQSIYQNKDSNNTVIPIRPYAIKQQVINLITSSDAYLHQPLPHEMIHYEILCHMFGLYEIQKSHWSKITFHWTV